MAKKPKGPAEHWQNEPEEKDFLAATNYLSLIFADERVASIVDELRKALPIRREASDLLRASRLALLPETDPVVKKNLKKVADGDRLSPVLLARGRAGRSLIVADGYHRICASYYLDENVEIACRLTLQRVSATVPPAHLSVRGIQEGRVCSSRRFPRLSIGSGDGLRHKKAPFPGLSSERMMGLEPTTFCMASRRSSQLSYIRV